MPKIEVRTPVAPAPREVFEGFTEDLFRALSPPWPKLTVVRYDGNQPGDIVHLRLGFGLWSQEWISEITSLEQSDAKVCMVDKGTKLPFPLTSWEHRHRIERSAQGQTEIIDEVHFGTGTRLFNFFMKLQVKGQMKGRRKKYQAYFGKP